jgi:hypothetical protein
MNIVTQSDIASHLPEPFAPHRRTAGAGIDVGCVDWYLYPVNRKARPPEGSRNARPGVAVAPVGEDHAA